MAEFQEVAKHWKRMCKMYKKSTTCHGCPIAENERSYEACYDRDIDVAKMEELVTAWAEENPVPVYPTWYRWLIMMGAVDSVEHLFSDLQRPIPVDKAQMLGIEPVPIVHGDCGATNEADARNRMGVAAEGGIAWVGY